MKYNVLKKRSDFNENFNSINETSNREKKR